VRHERRVATLLSLKHVGGFLRVRVAAGKSGYDAVPGGVSPYLRMR